MHKSSSHSSRQVTNVRYKGKWSSALPNTDMPRVAFLMLLTDAYKSTRAGNLERRDKLFPKVIDVGVLTVGQLSQVFQVSRQRVYIMLLMHRQELPDRAHRKQGTLVAHNIEYLFSVVKTIQNGGPESMTESMIHLLPACGTPEIIKLIVGVDYRGFNPYNCYRNKTYIVDVS